MHGRLLGLTISFTLALAPAALSAQGGPPQGPPKNLQVLPKDIPRPQLVALMRGVAGALGVRCTYCHVATEANGREEFDFPADDKEMKKTAREMFRMVMDINGKYMPAMGRNLTDRTRVMCFTCHRGLSKPRTLEAEVMDAYEKGGTDSATAKYRDLRTKYYGRAAYDFGDAPLVNASNEVAARADGRKDAIKLLQLNAEFNPKSPATYQAIAQNSLAIADTAAAVSALEKLIELDPENPLAKRVLGTIKKPE
jgi:hypothetical protein